MKKLLKITGIVILLFLIVIFFWLNSNWRDRHPDYVIDLKIEKEGSLQIITAGFSKMPITPTIVDTWNDANNDFKYNEKDGDTYNDNNKNGEFDAFWIAGMSNKKPAQGIHDEVWSRVMVIDDGNTRIAMVSLDVIGFMHDDVVDIRNLIPAELNIDYTLISSTHTHESEDMMGIWGKNEWTTGVNTESMKYVKEQTVNAITDAVKKMRPANLIFAEDLSGKDAQLMKDTRKPDVRASGIHLMQVIDSETEETLGTIINWANHPETLWNKNLLISSDFPHYVREALENGVNNGDELIHKGLGGVAIYFNGAIGGLMAPHPSLPIPDPFKDTVYLKPTFAKAKAIGDQIAILSLNALNNDGDTIRKLNISLRAKTLNLPLENTKFKLAFGIGLVKRGLPELFKIRTEIGAIKIGPAMFLSIPGEIYPEIVYGGIEAPEGREFDIQPLEIPPIQSIINDKYKFYIGLSNDEIGYIIPKSEWDVEKPYLYNDNSDTYGEENSLGPDTAPILYKDLAEIIKDLNE
ncbi:MAG: neutral/alkaline non-lysosomal ceramidase N-terminal domain-containing protein [Bacteroidota bacterium]